MRIVTIVGARPQFIKAAAVSREIKRCDGVEEIIVHTGQHYDQNMSDIFFREMEIPLPAYNLSINGLSQGAMTGQMLEKIEPILNETAPDIVLVYGDTNSTLAGALCARKMNIPIAHVEGGLRNFDLSIPEDVNRILTDRISDLIFYSTESALRNLQKEGYDSFPVELVRTGDLMADTVKYYAGRSRTHSSICRDMGLEEQRYMLVTVHRKSNLLVENMREIISALNDIAVKHSLVFPIHPNTKKFIESNGIEVSKNIQIIDPVGYFDMLQLLERCSFVITDSGGLQREAYLMGKKSLLLMEYTPWEELVSFGFSGTTPIERTAILENFDRMIDAEPDFSRDLYGDGTAARTIVDHIVKFIESRKR